jgi:hypothetical protein
MNDERIMMPASKALEMHRSTLSSSDIAMLASMGDKLVSALRAPKRRLLTGTEQIERLRARKHIKKAQRVKRAATKAIAVAESVLDRAERTGLMSSVTVDSARSHAVQFKGAIAGADEEITMWKAVMV